MFFLQNFSMNYWIGLGAPKSKLVMGMPIYGRGFTLANPADNGFYANAPQAGMQGPYTREPGILGFNEVTSFTSVFEWLQYDDATDSLSVL